MWKSIYIYYLLCFKNALIAWKIIKTKCYFVRGIFNGLNGEGRGKGHLSTLAWRKIKRSIKSATYASTWCCQVCSRCTHMAGKLETFFILYKLYSLLPRIRPNFACGYAFARLYQRLEKNGSERIRVIYDAQSRNASLTSSYD